MERIYIVTPFLVPLLVAGATIMQGNGGWLSIAVSLVSVPLVIPTERALYRWIGGRGRTKMLVVAATGGTIASLSIGLDFLEAVPLAALLGNAGIGLQVAARSVFAQRVPRFITGLAGTFVVSIFVIEALGGRQIGTISLLSILGVASGALVTVVGSELLLAEHRPLLPTPVQPFLSLIVILGLGIGSSIASGNWTAIVFGSFLVCTLLGIYHRRYFRFDDMVVFVDEGGEPVGTGPKLESHHENTALHRAFSVFLFNSDGEVLLQQRSFSKKTWPGVWSNSCCGHVMLHESTEAAANRRLGYELGLSRVELKVALPDFRYRAERDGVVENEVCPVLIGFIDVEPKPRSTEVADTRWLPWDEFVEMGNDPASGLSPWAVEEARLLAQSGIFQTEFGRRTANAGKWAGPGNVPLKDAA